MKILFVAYNCDPNEGSEDGIGWNLIKEMSARNELVVVTRGVFADEIKRQDLSLKGHTIKFEFINNPVSRETLIYKYLDQVLYYWWHVQASSRISKITSEDRFDVVQHLTWIRCWMPSAIMGAKSGAVVWGPVGGVEWVPSRFLKQWGKGKLAERLKKVVVQLSKWDPLVRTTARRARMGLAATSEARDYMKAVGCTAVELMPCVALSDEEISRLNRKKTPPPRPFRFVSAGRLLGWKGFQFGLEAFAAADLPDSDYWIIGDGPSMSDLQLLSKKLGIESKVKFLGNRKRAEVLELLTDCHVLVHPSFRDSGGWICLEAMATGLPVVCLDRGGPALLVDEEAGMIVKASSHTLVVEGLKSAMLKYRHDREFYENHSQASVDRINREFSWSGRANRLNQIYAELIE